MFAALVILSTVISAASATKSLTVSTTVPSSLVADVNSLQVVTTIANTGDETLKLLNDPDSPLSTWATRSFDVKNADGKDAEFNGVIVRYAPEVAAKSEDASEWTLLAPGESVDVTHDVGLYYDFSKTGAGEYTFTPANRFIAVESDGSLTDIIADISSAPSASLTGNLSATRALAPENLGGSEDLRAEHASGLQKRASYRSNCSASRQSTNAGAITAGQSYATKSYNHLVANTSGSTVWTTWFGAFAANRRTLALNSFNRLRSYPNQWTYDCSCTQTSTYAYIYRNEYGVVYLCGLYWNVPNTGSGSRADTIIHEGSHFTQVLGTEDYTYGEANSKNLARSSPTQAIYNADNHAFFSVYV